MDSAPDKDFDKDFDKVRDKVLTKGVESMKNALILGATSDLARAIAHRLAGQGWSLTLAARNPDDLNRMASDLSVRHGVPVHKVLFDALAFETHAAFAASLPEPPDAIYCVFGYLGDPIRALTDAAERRLILDTNYTGAVNVLEELSVGMAERGNGVIVGISSVAGDRGRGSHPLYGSAKAGFTAYLDGLRGRLFRSGVQVVTVLPGPMKTRMTEGMKLPPFITITPERAAISIVRAVSRRRNRIYVPGIWRVIMALLRMIPEPIFMRMHL